MKKMKKFILGTAVGSFVTLAVVYRNLVISAIKSKIQSAKTEERDENEPEKVNE